MKIIRYSEGWKYKLEEAYEDVLPIRSLVDIKTAYITLLNNGYFVLKKNYAWDGPSGPAIDSKNFMRPSAVHDALYSLMRDGYLSPEIYKEPADRLLYNMCLEDGMSQIRAWWVYAAVKTFAKRATTPEGKNPILTAP